MQRLAVGLFSFLVAAGGRVVLVRGYEAFRVSQVRGTAESGGAFLLMLAGLALLAGGAFGMWRAVRGRD